MFHVIMGEHDYSLQLDCTRPLKVITGQLSRMRLCQHMIRNIGTITGKLGTDICDPQKTPNTLCSLEL